MKVSTTKMSFTKCFKNNFIAHYYGCDGQSLALKHSTFCSFNYLLNVKRGHNFKNLSIFHLSGFIVTIGIYQAK